MLCSVELSINKFYDLHDLGACCTREEVKMNACNNTYKGVRILRGYFGPL